MPLILLPTRPTSIAGTSSLTTALRQAERPYNAGYRCINAEINEIAAQYARWFQPVAVSFTGAYFTRQIVLIEKHISY